MGGVTRNDFLRCKLIIPIPVIYETRPVGGNAIEVKIGIRLETLRLFICSGGVRVRRTNGRLRHSHAFPSYMNSGYLETCPGIFGHSPATWDCHHVGFLTNKIT